MSGSVELDEIRIEARGSRDVLCKLTEGLNPGVFSMYRLSTISWRIYGKVTREFKNIAT